MNKINNISKTVVSNFVIYLYAFLKHIESILLLSNFLLPVLAREYLIVNSEFDSGVLIPCNATKWIKKGTAIS